MIDQYNYGLFTNDQICYQHEIGNDVAHLRALVDEAEKFFNERTKEMEQVCINRLTDMFTSGSIVSQLARTSDLDSKVVPSILHYENKKG